MCGISVLFSSKSLVGIDKMTQLIRHRGPDDEGYAFIDDTGSVVCLGGEDTPESSYQSEVLWAPKKRLEQHHMQKGVVQLGHRRLSIVDLHGSGHQPQCSPDQRYWITYNGEIYNYLELKEELTKKGHPFYSKSDTEVLLAAFSEWGIDCLNRLNGMFSFAIYDREEKTLIAARDRFGIKPLYWWQSPEGVLAIASEVKQFTSLNGWKACLNAQMAYDFIDWGVADHSEQTLFQGVKQLMGGQMLMAKIDEKPKVQSWYQLPTGNFTGTFQQASETLYDLLFDAVRYRLRADVAVGSCLSGGLDSSTIVCLAAEILGGAPQKTFSACSYEKLFDEREYMESVVAHTDVLPHYLYPSLDTLFLELKELTWHQDFPFGSTSPYAQWKIFASVKQSGIKVMLDGQGADEQLAGYDGFLTPFLFDSFKKGHWIRFLQEAIALHKNGKGANLAMKALYYGLPSSLKQRLRKSLGYSSTLSSKLNQKNLCFTARDPHSLQVPENRPLQRLCYQQTMHMSVPMLCRFEDRNSMAHSIEARIPFLDFRVVEFLQTLPPEFKIRGGMTKACLREGMKSTLPQKIHQRTSKLGFATPEQVWIQKEQPRLFRLAIREAFSTAKGIFSEQALQEADQIILGKRPFSYLPWKMISFGNWMERFSVSSL